MSVQSVSLYYREGSSDKEYHASIEAKDGGYAVNFAYGRRGSTLSTGTKTNHPVGCDEAKSIYDRLVREKMAKGYTPAETGTPYQHTEKVTTGIHCQLLNPIEDAEKFIKDPEWLMQEKWDGRRMLIQKTDGKIIGINRLGLAVALPETLIADCNNCAVDFTLDGEAIGDTLVAFDLLFIDGEDIRGLRYTERHLRLMGLLGSLPRKHIKFIETSYSADEKQANFEKLKANGREGVVFKHTDALYIAGRPNSGGKQLKYKFCETASFIVGKVNAKRSVSLLLNNDGKQVDAGNVTIPPNHDIPAVGMIVECRYLYAFKESGCIYQPVYLGARDDIPADECTVDQLKYKTT